MPFEIEQRILGMMIYDSECIPAITQYVEERTLESSQHRLIFRAILRLDERNAPTEVLSVRDELEKRDELERAGGQMYLIELLDCVDGTANAEYYAKQVHEAYQLRRLKVICHDTLQMADQTDLAELIDQHEANLFRITEHVSDGHFINMEDTMESAFHKIADRKETGLHTGFYDLDELLGGFRPGEYVIVAGRPSMGKTAFCLSVAETWIKQGQGVGLFTLETTKEQIANRLISSYGRIPSMALRTAKLKEEQIAALPDLCGQMQKWPLFIDDSGEVSITQLRGKARRHMRRYHPAIFIVDYLQLLRSTQRYDSRNDEVKTISERLRAMAKELDVVVMAVSQLSRKPEDRTSKRPQLSDLRESGAIEQDANIVLLVYRPEFYRIKQFEDGSPTEGLAEIDVAKNKDGPTGTVKLAYFKEYTRFENLMRESNST